MITVHPSWQSIIELSYGKLSQEYREFLEKDAGYFPSFDNFLNAFKSLPLCNTKYILFGQDPYPREQSAIGYSFIDGDVREIFGEKGFSKKVNRATSLRNFLKMLLVAQGSLDEKDCSQDAIAKIDKSKFITNIMQLKENFEKNGVLLLNTSLIFTDKKSAARHAKNFLPFINELLKNLQNREIELIMLGNISQIIRKKIPYSNNFKTFEAMHPYNVQFIKDLSVRNFFKPMNLLISCLHKNFY